MYLHFALFPSNESLKNTSSFQFHSCLIFPCRFFISNVQTYPNKDILQMLLEGLDHAIHNLCGVAVSPTGVAQVGWLVMLDSLLITDAAPCRVVSP